LAGNDGRKSKEYPKHDVLVIILSKSYQCIHSIGWIHRPNYLE